MSSHATASREAIWHQVECGSYAADLALWSALAREAAGPVLELGCGTGRVALRLASEGFTVSALDSSPALVAELRGDAGAAGLEIDARVADARAFDLGRRFAAVIAPMQLVHLLGGPAGRGAMLERVAAHLPGGGVFAAALLAGDARAAADLDPPLPDVLERDRWVYSSLPIETRTVEGGLELRRLRQVVSPEGRLTEEIATIGLDELDPDRLEAEASAVGLRPRERVEIPPTADHVGSIACVLEARR
jgi:SAM-dependent methyltransferase